MHHYKRILAFLVIVMLLMSGVATVWAVGNITAQAGETTSLSFTFDQVHQLDGGFAINDPHEIIKSYSIQAKSENKTAITVRGTRLWVESDNLDIGDRITVTVTVTMKEDALDGERCTFTFTGNQQLSGKSSITSVYQSGTITTKTIEPMKKEPTEIQQPQELPDVPKEPESKPTIHRSELEAQITAAEKIDVTKYTKASGDALSKALNNGRSAVKSADQNKIDAATVALKSTMDGLKQMDYSKLNQALSDAEQILELGELTDLGIQLEEAMKMGSGLLISRDQVAVDTAVSHIEEVMGRIDKILGELKSPEVIEVEVPVEVPPTDDYCNIPTHNLWPMLLFLSAAMNVVLVALIVTYTVKKKKYQNDDTPLVEYDIEDDF